MKARLNQLNKGTIEYPKPVIALQPGALEGILAPGRLHSMEVTAVTENGIPMNLYLYSQNERVTLISNVSFGRSGKFTVSVDTTGLFPGETLSGSIDIVYNGGERKLPYFFSIGIAGEKAHRRDFATKEEFIKFAETDLPEARQLFRKPNFTDFTFMKDLHIRGLYQVFSKEKDDYLALNAFLKSLGKVYEGEGDIRVLIKNDSTLFEKRTSEASRNIKKNAKLIQTYLAYQRYLLNGRKEPEMDFTEAFRTLADKYPTDVMTRLVFAWYSLSEGDIETARNYLISLQDQVQKERLTHKDEYCFFLYLASTVRRDGQRLLIAGKLTHKYFMDGEFTLLMHLLEYHLNSEYEDNVSRANLFLKQLYIRDLSKTVFYQEMCLLFRKEIAETEPLTDADLRSLIYGLRHHLVTKEVFTKVIMRPLKDQKLNDLYLVALKMAYRIYGGKDILKAVADFCLKKKREGRAYVHWYELAVEAELPLDSLQEYYLRSIPDNYDRPVPENCLRYFAYRKEEEFWNPAALYHNILTFYQDNEEIMALYRERMEAYAVRCLKQSVYSMELIPLFGAVLNEEHLNEETAPGMMQLFYCRHLRSSLMNARKVNVFYPQLGSEEGFFLKNREAMVPIFSEEAVISFEDEKGHRIFDPSYENNGIFLNQDLQEKCHMYLDGSLLFSIEKSDRILKEKAIPKEDLYFINDLVRDERLEKFYRVCLFETMIDLSLQDSEILEALKETLLSAEPIAFDRTYRGRLLAVWIRAGRERRAFETMGLLGSENVEYEAIRQMVLSILKTESHHNNPFLTSIGFRLLKEMGNLPSEILSYLARFYSGNVESMNLLTRAVHRKKLTSKEVLERTFMTMFFTDTDKDMDLFFDWYLKEEAPEKLILDAVAVCRCHTCFLAEKNISDSLYNYLFTRVKDLPKVCLLEMLTMLSKKETLSEEEKSLAENLLEKAVEQDLILKCFREFENKITIPVELEGRVYVEIRCEQASEISVTGQILPDSRYFVRSLTEVYPGVYVKTFILYKREWMEYYSSIRMKDGSVREAEGEIIAQENTGRTAGSLLSDVAELENMVKKGSLRDSSELIRALILKEEMINSIFGDA